ncbi:hypothetical protein ABZS77_05165 [Micromonospora sp. NPDC005298]|uniref:hypothetical protein n=1 Tax=Micromonospora sp. NPDC005298 TaxID=3156873 RepID=UPI0033B9F9DB
MRDELAFVERIHRELNDVRWPEPQEIRARARRRSRRTIVVATVALTLVGGSAAALAEGGRGPVRTPVAAATLTPARGEIVDDSLLRPTDLAQAAQRELSQSGLGEPILVDHLLGYCRESQGLTPVWKTSRWSRSQTLLREYRQGAATLGGVLLTQDLYRVTPELAKSFLADLDGMVAPCAEWRGVGPYEVAGETGVGEAVHRWAVVDRNFAGDEASLVRHTVSRSTGAPAGDEPQSTSTAIVRVGDLIAVLSVGQDGTEADLRRLATVAAGRMCLAANPSC